MAQQEVVIVGADGTEHVFPAGFDPKRAAAIVRQQSAPASPSAADMLGMLGPHQAGTLGATEGTLGLFQRLKQLAESVSLTNPGAPNVVPELQPFGRVIETADRLMPFMTGDVAPGRLAANAAARTATPIVKTGRAIASGAELNPAAVLDFKVNQPLAWLKDFITRKGSDPAPAIAPVVTDTSRVPANATGTSWRPVDMPAATSLAGNASGGTAPPTGRPPVEAPPGSRSTGAKSPQQILNEEALARRRAAYQAQQSAPAAPEKVTLTAQESLVYLQLRAAGKTDLEALQAIEAARTMNQTYGLKTPTAAEKRFPKGMRGKPQPIIP